MSNKFGINYCDASDIMARCVALTNDDSKWCDGFVSHTYYPEKCSWCNELLGHTCGNWEQAEAYNQIGVVRVEDFDEQIEEDPGYEIEPVNLRTCDNCINQVGCASLNELINLKDKEGDPVDSEDLYAFAENCEQFRLCDQFDF